jgi:xanthine/uracil permease
MEGDAIEIVDVRVLGSMPQTNANVFARNGDRIGFSTMVLPKDFVMLGPPILRPFVSSGIITSFLVAAFLHIVFNLVPKTGQKEIENAKIEG